MLQQILNLDHSQRWLLPLTFLPLHVTVRYVVTGINVIACLGRWNVGQGKDNILHGAYLSPYPHTWTYGALCAHFVTTEHEHSRTVKRCWNLASNKAYRRPSHLDITHSCSTPYHRLSLKDCGLLWLSFKVTSQGISFLSRALQHSQSSQHSM